MLGLQAMGVGGWAGAIQQSGVPRAASSLREEDGSMEEARMLVVFLPQGAWELLLGGTAVEAARA